MKKLMKPAKNMDKKKVQAYAGERCPVFNGCNCGCW